MRAQQSRQCVARREFLAVFRRWTLRAMWCSAPPARWGWRGIVSKQLGSRYRSGRLSDWLEFKNLNAPAVKREPEEDWGPVMCREREL